MSSMTEPPVSPHRIFVFDHPRTRSQMFNRLFQNHEELENVLHPFMGASMYGPERIQFTLKHGSVAENRLNDLASDAHKERETYQVAAQRLADSIAAAEKKGKRAFVKDHVMCTLKHEVLVDNMSGLCHKKPTLTPSGQTNNPTWIPDDLYRSLSPLILIRHPARIIPSFYRTQTDVFKLQTTDEDFAVYASLRWLRIVFDSYREFYSEKGKLAHTHSSCDTINSRNEGSIWPLVVDAEDVVYNTQAIAEKLCNIWNIDSSGVQYSWKATPREERPKDKIICGFFDTLLSSTGVIQGNKPDDQSLDIDEEMVKWTTEFGEEVAADLR